MADQREKARRGYGQYCALARALDVIGDRWTLLIVRELLLRGPCRYTDVRHGLPGIATNLLADRLRALEDADIVRRDHAPSPLGVRTLYLSPRGEQLRAVVEALGRWGAPLLRESSKDDAFCSHWIAMPLEMHLVDRAPEQPPIEIEIRTGDQPMTVETVKGVVRVRPGAAARPNAIVTGKPQTVLPLLIGRTSLAEARRQGVRYQGRPAALRRIGARHPARPPV